MSFDAEATIAAELMKFAMNGTLYRGSKPVMWSVVEKTALAEAEVEYQEVTSAHDLREVSDRPGRSAWSSTATAKESRGEQSSFRRKCVRSKAEIVIWTTTPWTIPGNRAIAFFARASPTAFTR